MEDVRGEKFNQRPGEARPTRCRVEPAYTKHQELTQEKELTQASKHAPQSNPESLFASEAIVEFVVEAGFLRVFVFITGEGVVLTFCINSTMA